MSNRPRTPSHSRRSGYVPGVSSTIKTAKAPHEVPVGRPEAPRPLDPIQFAGTAPTKTAPPPHVTKAQAVGDVGDFSPIMAGVQSGTGLTVADSPLNLLFNGGFEDDLASPPNGWALTIPSFGGAASTLQATAGSVGTDLTEGLNYGAWTLPSGGLFYVAASAVVPIDPTAIAAVRGQIDVALQTLGASVHNFGFQPGLDFYDINGSVIQQSLGVTKVQTATPTPYATVFVDALVPAAAVSVQFFVYALPDVVPTGSSTVRLDNAQVNPFNEFTGYFFGSTITQSPSDASNALADTAYVDTAMPTGGIIAWPAQTPTVPTGYLACDGSAVSRTTYSRLYAVIGTLYGAGDGSTTFNVPNLHDLFILGAGGGHALGATGGSVHISHSHNLSGTGWAKIVMQAVAGHSIQQLRVTGITAWNANIEDTTAQTIAGSTQSGFTSATDLGGTTDVQDPGTLPPFMALTFVIKY